MGVGHGAAAAWTVPAVFRDTARRYGSRVALRHKSFGRWQDVSWEEYYERTTHVGMGLRALGLQRGDRVSVIGDNCPEWVTIDLGIQGAGGVTVGIYATSAWAQCAYVVNHSDSVFLFVENEEQLDKWLRMRDEATTVKKVIVWDLTGLRDFEDPMVMTLDELLALGRAEDATQPGQYEALSDAIGPDDTAVIVYTSGTTGPPKGAMLSHRNVVWIARTVGNLDDRSALRDTDEVLSFLPLCHIFERLFSVLLHIVYGYTVNFVERPDTVADNLREISPTIAYGVPRMWEKLHSVVLIRMADATWFKRMVFNSAIKIGRAHAKRDLAQLPVSLPLRLGYWLAHLLVFRKLKERLGLERVRVGLSGAAPIAPEVLLFFRSIGLELVEGYGQTESSGVISGVGSSKFKLGSVGTPLPGVEVRIADDGEILVRSPGVFQGYFKSPEATAATVVNGWLHTGDVGAMDEDGFLRLIDRKKDLIITAGGKNIAPQYIENKLKCSPFISDAIVIGDRRKYLTALIVLDEDNVVKHARDHKIPFSTYGALASDRAINALIGREVNGVNAQVSRAESVRRFRILPKRLYEEDGEVTPTMKVKRAFVHEAYGQLIEAMYTEG